MVRRRVRDIRVVVKRIVMVERVLYRLVRDEILKVGLKTSSRNI